MRILALDPGTEQSAWMLFGDGGYPIVWDIEPNENILSQIYEHDVPIVYEMIASQGMAVGAETFETVLWTGRFVQHASYFDLPTHRVFRRECKLHLCNSVRAKDGNVRQALIDLYGGSSSIAKEKKCGVCKGKGSTRTSTFCVNCNGNGIALAAGPLAGIASHCWAALAVAKTWWDTKREVVIQ